MVRDDLISRLQADLIGPSDNAELLKSRPSDCYLTGILFPARTMVSADEDEQLDGGVNEGETEGADREAGVGGVALSITQRQSSAGISFAIRTETASPAIDVEITCGTYRRLWEDPETGEATELEQPGQQPRWRRLARYAMISRLALHEGLLDPVRPVDESGLVISGLSLRIRTARFSDSFLVTAVLVNDHPACESRAKAEEASFFQVGLVVRACQGSMLIARPARRSGENDADALIYRDATEYAVGHTCSANWGVIEGDGVREVRTTWLPKQEVPAVSPEGDIVFWRLTETPGLSPRSAEWLSVAPAPSLLQALSLLPDAYEEWLIAQEARIPGLSPGYRSQAASHISTCRAVSTRIREAIGILADERIQTMIFGR